MLNYYTPTQAAKILGCRREYIHQLIRAGKLLGAEKVGNQWLIPAKLIDERKRKKLLPP